MARETVAHFTIEQVPAARVLRFESIHEAGRPLVLDVEVILYAFQELDAMIGKGAVLSFGAPGEPPRVIAGTVEAATSIGSTELGALGQGARYAVRVVSSLALLARSVDSRIFQEMSAKEIVAQVLSEHGVARVEWRLSGDCPKREYCVQYQESALAFVSRLMEHEGIYSFVEVDDEGEILVFDDDSAAAGPIQGDPALPFRRRTGLSAADERDAIYAIRERERVRSGKFVLRDFDFERPQLDLTATAASSERPALERYDYPGGYFEPSEGSRLAQIRLEEEQVERRTLEIEAVCPRLAVGHKLTITDAGELDGEYFLFSVTHTFVHEEDGERGGGGAARSKVRARLVPADVKYRPRRITPSPVIEGPQTATVVAPAGSQPEAIHTDEHGRCKVKFHWDRSDVVDDKASCWMRVAQLQTSGSMMLPRIDWEVIVEFLEGNPDRPIVTGRLYNGVFMPPYALPEGKTRTAIRTASTPGGGGVNEVRFEDKAGAEEIMMHAQHDMKTAAANNAKKNIGNNETTVVGNNASLEVGGNQTTKITKGSSNTVGADQTISVGGNRTVEVNAVSALTAKGNATTTVGGNQFEMDGNPLEAMLALAAQAAVQFASVMANNAISAIQGQVDGAINQVMAPINGLTQQVQGVAGAMGAVAGGDMSRMPAMIAGASGIPGASQLAASMGGGGGGGGAAGGGGGAAGAGGPPNMLAAIASNAAHNALAGGIFVKPEALASALGMDSGGGGGESMGNAAGPEGSVDGVDATDREKGPGHSTAKVAGTHKEDVGSMKVLGAIRDIDNNVTGKKTIDVGAATVQVAFGSYSESVTGSKNEKATGLVVLSNAGESETVTGSRTAMVGGAVVDKLKGSHVVQAVGPATFIGAFHKVEAKGAIVFKCGGSEVVIDGGGVTISSPLVAFLAPKIQLPKKVSEV
ncbi:type VI secretion system Vgr family protein [Sorangium sp. So ce1389]|uniref:type VI secretion system Vgr family protein n=1 Tax=Sorangium sp. So ce1389 TaxID=3133336 RepID=UPI003F6144E5